ncbi:hypothetical protein QAD02_015935 [Eretmocerus hayati]|uniref:Uncharacterized protein n=1 Tax=Eretmocerus hayati TaxID=131215 RepID=A0ACC2PAN6_9HYME|nr:hypothetical protein QAD02_015935 [Eretmocerus hayati]
MARTRPTTDVFRMRLVRAFPDFDRCWRRNITVMAQIYVQYSFRPLIEVPNQLVGAPMRTDVTLSCKVEASPKPINYWTRENGEMIISNDKYTMSEETTNMYSSWMHLVIKKLHLRDFGGYKCISKNSLGDAESGIRLYEIALEKHKPEHGSDDGYGNGADDREHNRLNNVNQGSLRESGSTLQPRSGSAPMLPQSTHHCWWLHLVCTIILLLTRLTT